MGLFNRKDAEQRTLDARAAAIQHAAALQAQRMAAMSGPRAVNVEEQMAAMVEALVWSAGSDAVTTSTVPAAGGDLASRLEQLAELRDRGALTPEEFEQQKQRILAAG